MNPIIEALLADFSAREEIDSLDQSAAFEQFAAFCVLAAERLDQGDFRDALTDAGEEGLDGIAIIVNGALMTDPSDVDDALERSASLIVKYVLIQAKSSEGWDGGEVLKFTRAVAGFFDGTDIGSSSVVSDARQIHEAILRNAARLENNPQLRAYYVTSGQWAPGTAAEKHLRELTVRLESLALFSSVRCEPIDRAKLQQFYRSATSAATATVEFDSKVTLPKIAGIEQAYLGVLPASELMKLVVENGSDEVRRSVFEDNVRDFQGVNAPVNSGIRATLRGDHPQRFAVLNNGVTIVVRDLRVTANSFRLSDYQIVNGAQTSNVLFANRDALERNADVQVPTRIIQTDNEELITEIVTATNSQTQVRPDELNARAVAERHVEKYFAAQPTPRNLLYERRSKQYDSKGDVIKARVVDRYTLVRATAAVFTDEPHLSTGYPMQLLSRLSGAKQSRDGHRLVFFSDSDEPLVYYAAASAYYRLDLFLKTFRLEARFKPARWYLLTAARHLALDGSPPGFHERKFRAWAKPFVEAVWSDTEGLALFNKAAGVIDESGLTLTRTALRNASAAQDLLDALRKAH